MLIQFTGELFKYPFIPDVWGTVSDWVMVIVTIVTAIYLIKTFKSQKRVQEIQQKQFDLERARFAEGYKPIFEYLNVPKKESSIRSNLKKIIKVKNLSKHLAKNVFISVKKGKEFIKEITSIIDIPMFGPNEEFTINFDLTNETENREIFEIVFEVKYEDIHKHIYPQEVIYFHFHGTDNVFGYYTEFVN